MIKFGTDNDVPYMFSPVVVPATPRLMVLPPRFVCVAPDPMVTFDDAEPNVIAAVVFMNKLSAVVIDEFCMLLPM